MTHTVIKGHFHIFQADIIEGDHSIINFLLRQQESGVGVIKFILTSR